MVWLVSGPRDQAWGTRRTVVAAALRRAQDPAGAVAAAAAERRGLASGSWAAGWVQPREGEWEGPSCTASRLTGRSSRRQRRRAACRRLCLRR